MTTENAALGVGRHAITATTVVHIGVASLWTGGATGVMTEVTVGALLNTALRVNITPTRPHIAAGVLQGGRTAH